MSFRNVRSWTSVTTRNGHIPLEWVWPHSGHELLDSSPLVRFTMIDTFVHRGCAACAHKFVG
jgi:hypothetical protein